jgi:hydrogenase nickel incorporation protein HypB
MSVRVINVGEKILGKNDDKAKENKKLLDERRILTINIMSSPGAGKTSLILGTIKQLSKKYKIAVVEGDVASSVDAEKVAALGIPVVQINTGGACHLDAFMVEKGINNLSLGGIDLLFIENVGNLICPNAYLLGEDIRLMIASLPEGDDKPYKYPAMFADSDVVILNRPPALPRFQGKRLLETGGWLKSGCHCLPGFLQDGGGDARMVRLAGDQDKREEKGIKIPLLSPFYKRRRQYP